tara:strand:- start:472 stop:1326 length:855 start_codon:yes stop_codon:yes gene_type:complete
MGWETIIPAAVSLYGASKGGGDKQTVTNQVDPATQARYDDLYGRAKGIAGQPFVPYTGARVAGFNPDQLQGFDSARGMFQDSMSYNPRGLLSDMGTQPLDIQSFQNPYNTQVIDQSLADLDRARQIRLQSDQDRAIGAGAFGGSRSALLEAETNRNFADAAARTSSNLRQSGYNNSLNAAMQDRNFRSGIQSGLLGDQYRNLGLLSGIGTQQQGLQQAGMDAGYNEFLRALGYGPQQLGLLQGAVHGMTPAFNNTTSNQRDSFTRLSDGINAYNAVKGFFPTTG